MKSKKSSLISLALILVLGLQCKKEEQFPEIETWGYVFDEVTREPVAGAKVLFYNSVHGTTMVLSTTICDSTYTNENGFFKKKWKLTKGNATQMNYQKEGYYHYKDLRQNAKGDVGIRTIKPNKNFRLYIKNIPPIKDDDSLFVNIGLSSDGEYRSMSPRWFVGDNDTLINVRIAYDEPFWSISYHYKDKNGGWHYYGTNPPCTPLDTCDIILRILII